MMPKPCNAGSDATGSWTGTAPAVSGRYPVTIGTVADAVTGAVGPGMTAGAVYTGWPVVLPDDSVGKGALETGAGVVPGKGEDVALDVNECVAVASGMLKVEVPATGVP